MPGLERFAPRLWALGGGKGQQRIPSKKHTPPLVKITMSGKRDKDIYLIGL